MTLQEEIQNNEKLNLSQFRENNRYEAKLAKGGLPANIWDTYSAFANTDGGLILLGVKENKDHSFMFEDIENPEKLEKAFWDNINNKKVVNINILNNSNFEIKEIEGKHIILITVPRAERIYRPVYRGNRYVFGNLQTKRRRRLSLFPR